MPQGTYSGGRILTDDGPLKRKSAVALVSDNVQNLSIAQLKAFFLGYLASIKIWKTVQQF